MDTQALLTSCDDSQSYPLNILRSLSLEYTLESYQNTLRAESRRLFNPLPQRKKLCFWETNDAVDEFQEFQPSDISCLREHCQDRNRQDPACRHVFIQSRHARDKIGISYEEFTYLLSYHQVIPSFLDLVFTCGEQENLRDFHYTAFRHENYLMGNDSPVPREHFPMMSLGRSGRQIQHCYNLHSVERSQANPDWKWSIRQTVVYHSFDIETGKSFWVFIKGNDVIKKRIMRSTKSTRSRKMNASSHQSVSDSFDAALTTHNQIMEWCDEQWRWYINEIEDSLRSQAKNAANANVDALTGPDTIPPPSRPGTWNTNPSRQTSFAKTPLTSPSSTWRESFSSKLSPSLKRAWSTSSSTTTAQDPEKASPFDKQVEKTGLQLQTIQEDENLEDMFSFEKLQDLHQIGEYMQEALMVIKLNRRIIHELCEHYTSLVEAKEFPESLRDQSRRAMSEFLQRAHSIESDLEVQQSRLETLNILLEDRSNLASADFTTDMTRRMHLMTEKMHEIALKTGRQTVSMHAITVFTLIFLPGTFLATFFSSGILRWYESDDEIASSGSSWVMERDRLLLYIEISIPMMVIIIIGWIILYMRARTRRSHAEDMDELLDLEKLLWETKEPAELTRSRSPPKS